MFPGNILEFQCRSCGNRFFRKPTRESYDLATDKGVSLLAFVGQHRTEIHECDEGRQRGIGRIVGERTVINPDQYP